MKKLAVLISISLLKCYSGTCLRKMALSIHHKARMRNLQAVGLNDVQWTKGFWAERFAVCRDSMVPHLWETYTSKDMCYSFQNFRVAAGLDTGQFRGPSFHDGDFYKTLGSRSSYVCRYKR